MGGFYYEGTQPQFPLTALQLAKSQGFERPTVTEEEIQDRSKQDWFAKSIAALQFLQLALSLIVRTNQGLDFSQLETITLGLAVCGAVIYLIYLYKPQGVGTRTSIALQNANESQHLRFEKTYDSFWDVLMNERNYANEPGERSGKDVPTRIPNDNIPISDSRVAHPGVFLLAFASGLFGAMHAIAWHFEFPSTAEKILWQMATVVAAGSPVVGLVAIPFAQATVSAGDPKLFTRKCLRLIREFSWYSSDKESVGRAYEKLESILINTTKQKEWYDSIFSQGQDRQGEVDLGRELLKFLEEPDSFTNVKMDLHDDKEFIQQFRLLVHSIEGKVSKKLIDAAKTNVFPHKSLLPKAFNKGILYVTSILYCLSRVSLLGVAFSSLRLMPESVYVNTPWTGYIPALGSSR